MKTGLVVTVLFGILMVENCNCQERHFSEVIENEYDDAFYDTDSTATHHEHTGSENDHNNEPKEVIEEDHDIQETHSTSETNFPQIKSEDLGESTKENETTDVYNKASNTEKNLEGQNGTTKGHSIKVRQIESEDYEEVIEESATIENDDEGNNTTDENFV